MTTATASATTAYDNLIKASKEAQLLGGTQAIMAWDQEVMMAQEGVSYRANQLALLAKLHHEMATDPRIGDWLKECEQDPAYQGDTPEAANVREIRHDYDRKTKLPADLVEEEARHCSAAHDIWKKARQDADFSQFEGALEQMVDILQRKAKCYGWAEGGEPWDALAEDYEPGCTAADVETVFTPLRDRLQGLLTKLMGSDTSPSNAFNERKLPIEKQKLFVKYISEEIGFDYSRGRLDIATHPFCSGTHPDDVRLTTRFSECNLNDALGSTMHEAGHGIYEQGLLVKYTGTPMGESVSLGIHESQSRMWENQVGRSRAFWEWAHPRMLDYFGDDAKGLDLETVYGGANIVRPDFIRVEADEATYNMHIMVRFEMERGLLSGDIAVKDVPRLWNEKYKAYLGLDVPNDAKGCLQDIHWSMGSMGYFPTYTLGNLYSAQFFAKALQDMPDLYDQFRKGEFTNLREWLNENIHQHGRRYRAAELCERVTGESLSAEPLLKYLEAKLGPLYGI